MRSADTPHPVKGRPVTGPKDIQTGQVIARLLRDYISGHWGLLSLAVLCMLFTSAMNGAVPYLVNLEVKQIFVRQQEHWLIPLVLVAVGIVILRAASLYFGRATLDSLSERTVAAAQSDMFGSLIRRDLAALNAVHSGQFISNFLYDATMMRDALTLGLASIFLESVQLVIFLAYVLISDWQLGLMALVAIPGVAWAMERLGGSIRRAATCAMQETGDLSTVLSEAMDGRRIIKAYGLEHHSARRVDERLAARLTTLLKAVRLRAAAAPVTDLFAGGMIAMVLLVAGWQNLHGDLTFNAFAGFLTALLLAQQPVRNLSQLWPTVSSGVAAAARIFESIDARPRIIDRPGAGELAVAPDAGTVHFQNVSFAYHPDASPALRTITLEIPAGQKVALVGPSGAGKSTIFNLLLRFYEPGGGTITIDGQDIQHVTMESLRAAIGVVTQESVLFDDSIADNIALGMPGATMDQIEAAARDAAAHEFIVDMPEGYATKVGEGGLKLSGGQRQRVAIARAMLRAAPILLLDEATSALDTTSEARVQEALARLMKGRTTIVIAHRLSTVVDADRIYVLDQGMVAEQGTHASLMAQGGLYASLYSHALDEAAT